MPWSNTANIKGATGAVGATGSAGAQGVQGVKGDPGAAAVHYFSTVNQATDAYVVVDGALDKGWDVEVIGKLIGFGADRHVTVRALNGVGSYLGGWYEAFGQVDYRDGNNAAVRARVDAGGTNNGWVLGRTIFALDSAVACRGTIGYRPGEPSACISHATSSPLVTSAALSFMTYASSWEAAVAGLGYLYFYFEGGQFSGTISVRPMGR